MIAISYRREDSLPIAGRLYDRLEAKFGKKNVFMDFDSIPPGADFRQHIKQMIERSKLVIAIIGPHWLGEQPDAPRRIDNPADFVRLEIAYALEGGIPIIPLLINTTQMPKPEMLPPEIQELAFRHALPLDSGMDFHSHADRLITGIAKAMPVAPEVPQKLRQPAARKPIERARVPVRSQRLLAAICVSCTAVVMSLRFVPAVPVLLQVWGHEQALQDWLHRTGRRTATHPEFVFVAISTKSLAAPESAKAGKDRMLQLMAEHPFPWSREVWARLLDRLFESGAQVVIFDLLFNSPNEGDGAFRAALDRYRDRVVIGENFDLENGNAFEAPNADLIPPPAQYDDRVGYVNYWVDKQDGMLRAARFFTSDRQLARQESSKNERQYTSFVARAMEKLGRSNEVPHDFQDYLIRFSAADAYQKYPIWEIADPDIWHSKYSNGEFFEGKIVIVGPSAPKLHDVIDNPISPEIKGPVMQLNVLAATMDHEFLRKLPIALDLLIVSVFGLLAWLLLDRIGRWLFCLLSFLALGVAYLLLAFLLYNFLGIFVPIVPPLMTLLGCGFLGFVAQQLRKRSHSMVQV